ncbi:MAG: B12-binding domain-containing radical SAM protein, partial [Deltaproteobacteria bacterium]
MKYDTPNILLVNPWIHDFAAYDFWAKPLGLLSLASILRQHGFSITYIDCLDRFHPKAPH